MTSAFDDMLAQNRQRLAKLGVTDSYATGSVAGQVDSDYRTRAGVDEDTAAVAATSAADGALAGTINGLSFSFRPGEGS